MISERFGTVRFGGYDPSKIGVRKSENRCQVCDSAILPLVSARIGMSARTMRDDLNDRFPLAEFPEKYRVRSAESQDRYPILTFPWMSAEYV